VNRQAKIEEIYALAAVSIALPIHEGSSGVTTFHLRLEHYLQVCEVLA
jgi:hypothetical protein